MQPMNTPLYDAILTYSKSKPTAFHMPGHKLGRVFAKEYLESLAKIDVTEIPGTDNLYSPDGPIKEAQRLAAEAFDADLTFFLVNGTTGGIHAMILAACKPGDTLLVARDCHRSVVAGMMLAGVKPVYIKPELDKNESIPGVISSETVEKALKEHPEAIGVFITRPNYYGVCCNVEMISEIVHKHGKLLLVDEAHGTHLHFGEGLPVSSVTAGADMCVQSAHKTVPAFTQAAYLHVKGTKVDIDRLRFYLSSLQTSSPSYILMSSLDIARAILQRDGKRMLRELLDNISFFKKELEKTTTFKTVSLIKLAGIEIDPSRMVLSGAHLGITGYDLEKILRKKFNIQVEMSDMQNIVCITTIADTREDFEKLLEALRAIDSSIKNPKPLLENFIRDIVPPLQAIPLHEVMNLSGAKISLQNAIGRVSRQLLTPYPPGIPLVCPGEVIGSETIECILAIVNAGGNVTGLDDDLTVEVVTSNLI